MSLSDDIQIAQMRSSMALALASSGAILSAPNSVSRLYVEPPRPLGGVVEGDGQVRGACADAGETAAIPKAAATTRTGNRELMPLNLFPHSRAASGKTETKLRRPVRTSRQTRRCRINKRDFSPIPRALALAGFEAALRLIDDIDATLAPHDAIVAMAAAQRFQ